MVRSCLSVLLHETMLHQMRQCAALLRVEGAARRRSRDCLNGSFVETPLRSVRTVGLWMARRPPRGSGAARDIGVIDEPVVDRIGGRRALTASGWKAGDGLAGEGGGEDRGPFIDLPSFVAALPWELVVRYTDVNGL